MINVAIDYEARLSTGAGPITAGQVVCLDPTTKLYVPATDAARAAAGGVVSGVAMTSATTGLEGFILLVDGEVPPTLSGLAAGVASPLVVSGTGFLARKATPVYGTDSVVGDCYADGTAVVRLGVSQKAPPEAAALAAETAARVAADNAEAVTRANDDASIVAMLTPPQGADKSAQYKNGSALAGAPGLSFPSDNEAQFPTSSPPAWNNGGTLTAVTAAGTTTPKTLTLPNVTGYLGALTQKDISLAGPQDNLDTEVMAGCTKSLYFDAGATAVTGFVAPIAAVGEHPARLEIYHPNGITGSNEDAASTAANRMVNWPTVAGVPVQMTTATLVYNTTIHRWSVLHAQALV